MIKHEVNGNNINLMISGELNIRNSLEIKNDISKILKDLKNIKNVFIDLSGSKEIDYTFLQILVSLEKQLLNSSINLEIKKSNDEFNGKVINCGFNKYKIEKNNIIGKNIFEIARN